MPAAAPQPLLPPVVVRRSGAAARAHVASGAGAPPSGAGTTLQLSPEELAEAWQMEYLQTLPEQERLVRWGVGWQSTLPRSAGYPECCC
jgi:hypothetical protein